MANNFLETYAGENDIELGNLPSEVEPSDKDHQVFEKLGSPHWADFRSAYVCFLSAFALNLTGLFLGNTGEGSFVTEAIGLGFVFPFGYFVLKGRRVLQQMEASFYASSHDFKVDPRRLLINRLVSLKTWSMLTLVCQAVSIGLLLVVALIYAFNSPGTESIFGSGAGPGIVAGLLVLIAGVSSILLPLVILLALLLFFAPFVIAVQLFLGRVMFGKVYRPSK